MKRHVAHANWSVGARSDPFSSAAGVLALQRSAGNRAVGSVIRARDPALRRALQRLGYRLDQPLAGRPPGVPLPAEAEGAVRRRSDPQARVPRGAVGRSC